MGADLYIDFVYQPQKRKYEQLFDNAVSKRNKAQGKEEEDKYQKEVTKYYNLMYAKGYFRDSYNDSNLLWKFGLDYWTYLEGKLDGRGNLMPDKAKEFLKDLKSKEPQFRKNLIKFSCEKATKDEPQRKIYEFFIVKYKELRKFLNTAIRLNQPISCSV